MSELVIAYYDDVLRGPVGQAAGYPTRREELEGTLLYRGRLSAPLDSLGLIYSIRHLPPGPGAQVLGWVTLLLAAAFLGGFFALHRLARGQLRLARQQQDFVSAVSHELKTPLTSIRMYGEMLKEGWAGDDKRQQYYEYIHDESERLTRLISNVLQLASITRNETNLAMRPRTVGELMDSVETKVPSQVQRAGFDVVFDRDERAERALVVLDEDCFLQIVINLVDNAIKFSAGASDKRIEIGSRRFGHTQVVFSVRDFGPGVPKDQMKKIFELFYRSENELTRETVGTGIGLAIVHQLSVEMQGSVDVVNRNPGAEFRVSFPTERAESPIRGPG
jgi:signal transduction histidine kinase